MIGYVTLGTNDFEAAAKFYDELLAEMGAKRFMDMERFIGWSAGPGKPSVAICKPFDKETATVGNGMMVALFVDSQEKVDTLYAKALELGGTDEGKPGIRMGSFYVAYFRDLDGNKLNFFTM